jgi:hypothetical protein
MKTTSNKVLKAAAIASLLAGGAIAGSFISTESAQAQTTTVQAQDSQSRVSGALTSVLSNGVTNSFAAEIVYPQNDYVSDGKVIMNVTYTNVAATSTGDISQVAITSAQMVGVATAYTSGKTVEAATARAIDAATTNNRFGDINGIVKSWRGSNGLD